MAPHSEKKIGICTQSKKRLENFVQILMTTRQAPPIIVEELVNSIKDYKDNKCTPLLDTMIKDEHDQYQDNMKICFDLPYPSTILQCMEDTERNHPLHALDRIMESIARAEALALGGRKLTDQPLSKEKSDDIPSFYG